MYFLIERVVNGCLIMFWRCVRISDLLGESFKLRKLHFSRTEMLQYYFRSVKYLEGESRITDKTSES